MVNSLFIFVFLFLQIQTDFAFAADKVVGLHQCGTHRHWVRAHPKRAYTEADGTLVRASFVSAHCQDNSRSYSFWKDRLKNVRPPNWPEEHSKEKSKNWSDDEIERVLGALNDLPEILWAVSIRSISRMDKSIYAGNSASGILGNIVVYDEAFAKDKNLARVLAHELAHTYFENKLSKEQKRSYSEDNGWYRFRENQLWKNVGRSFVEPDGAENPEEDFANNVEYYLFNKAKLRSVAPTAVEWIQNHFADKLKLNKR